MNNEKVIQWIESAASKISDFAVEQVPPFITEYLNWKFWEAATHTVIFMIPILIVWGLYIRFRKFIWGLAFDRDGLIDPLVVPVLGGTMVLILATGAMFPLEHIKDMIQISIAPKVYLLEKAAEIVKQ
jgi:hypothetical protein